MKYMLLFRENAAEIAKRQNPALTWAARSPAASCASVEVRPVLVRDEA